MVSRVIVVETRHLWTDFLDNLVKCAENGLAAISIAASAV